jgi:hypothetical protein
MLISVVLFSYLTLAAGFYVALPRLAKNAADRETDLFRTN